MDKKCRAYRTAYEQRTNIIDYWAERGFQVDAWVVTGKSECGQTTYGVKTYMVDGRPSRRRARASRHTAPEKPRAGETVQEYEARMGHKPKGIKRTTSGVRDMSDARRAVLEAMPVGEIVVAAELAQDIGFETTAVCNQLVNLNDMGFVKKICPEGQRFNKWQRVA